jgi:hypothetical protein
VLEQIRLVEDDQAQGRVRAIYHDIKRTMAVPVVGDIFRAFAAFPSFLEVVWWEVKPLVGSEAFEGLADRIRAHALACARQHCYVPDHAKALASLGIDEAGVARVRAVGELFYQTDPRLLVVATAVRESLTTGAVGRSIRGHHLRRRIEPSGLASLPLVSPASASEDVWRAFDEVQTTLGVPFVPADFRALALWPDYLQLAWDDVKGQVRTAQFRRDVQAISGIALAGVAELPRLVRVDATTVRAAGVSEEQLSQIYALQEVFQRLMPALVGTIALMRLGLNSMLEHELLELEAGA